jgi:tetratricopeptide (TPR) repeat protein
MNITKTIAFAICCLLITGSTYSQDADIKKVIANESEFFAKKDMAGWQSTWLHDASSSWALINGLGYFTANGWDSIAAKATRNFARFPKADAAKSATDSFSIRKEGNLAIVDYKQTLTLPNLAPFDQFVSWEHRELIKKGGQWKIVKQISTDLTVYGPNGTELMMNAVGYIYLFKGDTEHAIEILTLNSKLFPNSFNVFDSLGEAYAQAGQKELAIQNYKKSLELNPNSDSGKKALEGLAK